MVCVAQTAGTRELRAHEPKQLRCGVPWASLVCMSQVSGSRKSTIFNDLVHSALRHKLRWKALFPAGVKDEKGVKAIDKKIEIKQSPIWRNTLSNPVICTGYFDSIHQEFGQR